MDISDIMIHFNATLSATQRSAVEESVRGSDGVIAARFNPGKEHLLVVAFDPARVRAASLLAGVRTQGYAAQLIGG